MKKSLVAVFMFTGMFTFAQVTSSAISGVVRDANDNPVSSSSVVVIHEPSGTRYTTKTNAKGVYTLPNVRVGGPYKIIVTASGKSETQQSDIYTTLGNTANIDLVMGERVKSIEGVQITAVGKNSSIINAKATGASTTYGVEALNRTPTVGRTVNDVTKYNPYGNGRSFGGQDARFNNFTIDGAVFNNGFGLGSQAQAGGRTGSGAISIDAIEEIQVNVAPYDVKQSGFAGAAINAVTRSGTNQFSGSVFNFWNSGSLTGKKAYDQPFYQKFSTETMGVRVGGPIIKNKLFFFVNVESTEGSSPALNYATVGSGTQGVPSRVLYSDMVDLRNFMQEQFGVNIGAIDGYNNNSYSRKYLGRLDWNINDRNKLSFRYARHDSQTDVMVSNSSSAGWGNRTNLFNAISPQNSGYGIQDNTRSYVMELNSTLSNTISNQFIATYNKQIEDRSYKTPGIFPTIDILKDGQTYTSLGMDPFTPNNRLNYSTLNLANNMTVLLGKHTLAGGLAYERFDSNNLFFPASNGVYVYNSIEDFKTAVLAYKANPNATVSPVSLARYDYGYSLLPDGRLPWSKLKVHTMSAYLQDTYQPMDNLRLMLGARLDYVSFVNTAADYANPVVEALRFKDPSGNDYKINTATMPKGRLYVSPRFGFNYDVFNDKKTQFRGGTGVFLSRLPYVLISNQLGNNGVNVGRLTQLDTTAFPFTLDPSRFRPTSASSGSGYQINYTDPNIKFPQVWRTNIAVDQKLPFGGIVATVEGIYNKNINALNYMDVNMKQATGTLAGVDNRPLYPSPRFINSQVSNAFVLTNNNKGYQYSLTGKLEKPVTKSWGGIVAYTYSKAINLAEMGSTVNGNVYSTVRGINYLEPSFSANDMRHRVMSNVTYRLNYGDGLFGGATTFTLGFIANSGWNTTYVYNRDLNGDGLPGNDLMFVPLKASDLVFESFTSGGTTFTAQQQAEAFERFISGSAYLNGRRGQYTERNAIFSPWVKRFDLSIEQDIVAKFSRTAKPNTFRIRLDILNVGNLFNNRWGVGYNAVTTTPLLYQNRKDANGNPIYRLNTQLDESGKTILLRDQFQRSATLNDVFQIQIGLRYIFNK
ncbi:TonB-dependent receptor [Bergeyella sp. RCAD1439]|uniref:TonB-dependent receptor n=1 Tax=Bergeyella anatis TaxID=3113737 RepID=UPI002E171654|nr:carboxypeptidase regulatory-like domain-containing protein [Bergeyella sp. RCAD1439]